jgi:hypothetical protein
VEHRLLADLVGAKSHSFSLIETGNPSESPRRPEALSNARLSSVGWRAAVFSPEISLAFSAMLGVGWRARVCQRRFCLKSPPDFCGHFTLHWNARAPRAKRCWVRTADHPGGDSPCRIRAMAAVEFPIEPLGTAVSDGAWLWASARSRSPACFQAENIPLRTAPWQQ